MWAARWRTRWRRSLGLERAGRIDGVGWGWMDRLKVKRQDCCCVDRIYRVSIACFVLLITVGQRRGSDLDLLLIDRDADLATLKDAARVVRAGADVGGHVGYFLASLRGASAPAAHHRAELHGLVGKGPASWGA
jgi:hypothetical protein